MTYNAIRGVCNRGSVHDPAHLRVGAHRSNGTLSKRPLKGTPAVYAQQNGLPPYALLRSMSNQAMRASFILSTPLLSSDRGVRIEEANYATPINPLGLRSPSRKFSRDLFDYIRFANSVNHILAIFAMSIHRN